MRKVGCSMIEGMALVAILVRSRGPEMMDADGVGRRGCATVRWGEDRETETVDEEGVGRRGCAAVRCGGEWVIRGGRGARIVMDIAGSSEI